MQKRRYALVAYLKNPAGEFVEKLRRELHPDLPHLPAHLTILPPRTLNRTEAEALQLLDRVCAREQPFEVVLGDVTTFIPVTPTVYIQIESGGTRMCELHARLNIEALTYSEEWPYVPHFTIAKMNTVPSAQGACQLAGKRWAHFKGNRRILLEKLTFVREETEGCWTDLAPVPLGGSLVVR